MVSLSRLYADRRYYERNRERINKRCRDYYSKHRDELTERQRQRREKVRMRGDVCDILIEHAGDVAEDPDSLSSDFILQQIEELNR